MFDRLLPILKILFFTLVFLLVSMTARAKPISIYYFYPDSPSSNLSQIKSGVEDLFSASQLHVVFQPFARLNDFNRQIKKAPPDFLMSPAWYKSEKKLEEVLRAYRQGRTHYVKFLIVNTSLNLGEGSFSGKSLASTVMGYDTTWLSHLFGVKSTLRLDEANVIEVVKDIDAIFAVALRQVDMAVVAEATMQKLKKINPRLIASIKIVAESKPLPIPVLMQFLGSEKSQKKMEFVEFMDELNKQNAFEKLLLIDDWKVVK